MYTPLSDIAESAMESELGINALYAALSADQKLELSNSVQQEIFDLYDASGATLYTGNTLQAGTILRVQAQYIALATQVGGAAPTAVIIANSIGAVVYSRTGVGTYLGTLGAAFPAKRTTFEEPILAVGSCSLSWVDANSFKIETFDANGDPADGLLNGDMIIVNVH